MKKCDRCKREATVHDIKLLKGGIVSEVHLCAQCAAELGVKINNYPSADEFLQQAIAQQTGLLSIDIQVTPPTPPAPPDSPASPDSPDTPESSVAPGSSASSPAGANPSPAKVPARPGWCPNCSTTWSEFIDRGLFGCPECYSIFEDKIGPLLGRAHEGGTHHVGKFPQRGNHREDEEVRVRYLHKQLEDAVASEQFEQAVQIRDQIRALAEVEKNDSSEQAKDVDHPSSREDVEERREANNQGNKGSAS